MAFAISPVSALNPWLQILAALEKSNPTIFRDLAQAHPNTATLRAARLRARALA